MSDYDRAAARGLTKVEPRWENGIPHHPQSVRLFKFIQELDWRDADDAFNWKCGGDGDNGEQLMYEMDAYFELLDLEKSETP